MFSIYIITNTTTGKVYVGKAANPHKRWLTHQARLRRGAHPCAALQAEWLRLGSQHFEMQVIEACTDPAAEKQWINAFPDTYNYMLRDDQPKTAHTLAGVRRYSSNAAREAFRTAMNRPEVKKKQREARLAAAARPETFAKMSKAKSKPCTIDGITVYPSRNALVAVLGHGKHGSRHPGFRYLT